VHDPSRLERIALRRDRETFGRLLDNVASGRLILVCRRSTPLAVVLPKDHCRTLVEVGQRDRHLAVLRGRGVLIVPRSTTNLTEARANVGRS
jgi:antitoxin (DNA-binding transcriptional repressor) of toxin-antitoxin stability system